MSTLNCKAGKKETFRCAWENTRSESHGRLPRQVALYVSAEPLGMQGETAGPGWVFRFRLVDIRDLDLELLLCQIEKKFGAVPARIHERIALLEANQIEAAGLRLLDAQRIEDLFASWPVTTRSDGGYHGSATID